MAVLLTTVSTVTINDLGGRSFVHPLINYDLTSEFSYDEIRNSDNLGTELDGANITLTNDGVTVNNSTELKQVQPKQTAATSEVIVLTNVNPTVNDDDTQSRFIGQRWVNQDGAVERSFIAISVATGAAVWKEITPIGGITTGDDGELEVESGLTLGNAITQAISTNEDDLVVTDIEKAIVLRFDTTGNITLTGLVPKSTTKAWMIYISNVGTGNLALKDNDAVSTAENRFLLGGNKTLQQNEGVLLFYDPVSNRWRGAGIVI